MAVNLDTRLPLAAIGNPLNPAGVMQNARANAIQQNLMKCGWITSPASVAVRPTLIGT